MGRRSGDRAAGAATCGSLPGRWIIESSFAWATRIRQFVKDYERYVGTVADLHLVTFVRLCSRRPLYSPQIHKPLKELLLLLTVLGLLSTYD